MEVIYILFGWVLGILSPVIVDYISRSYSKKILRKTITSELKDVKIRLVLLPLRVNSHYGTVKKSLFKWISEQTQNFNDLESQFDEEINLEVLNSMIEKTSTEDLEAYYSTLKRDKPAFHFKKMTISIMDSNLMNIGILDNELLTKLLDVKFQINAFNEEIQNVGEYLKMTFDSSMSDTNHQIIEKAIKDKNLIISEKAMLIVEKINDII